MLKSFVFYRETLPQNFVSENYNCSILFVEGKTLAQNTKVKFIEASVGIQHNIDELLVGVLKQIRLKREKSQGNSQNIGGESSPSKRSNKYYRRASSPLRTLQVARDILSKICITHQNSTTEGPCENLMVP